MKVGDLVQGLHSSDVGIVIEVIDHIEVPPVVKVLWPDGTIDKEWTDELQLSCEGSKPTVRAIKA